jgi:GxxExxY protein
MEDHNYLAKIIVDSAFQVHSHVGPGLLETVYETILLQELHERGLSVNRQQPIPIHYKAFSFNEGFRADLIVNDKVIVELKSLEKTAPIHKKQLLTYLRLSGMRLGLLINFGESLIKNGIHRVVNGL